MRSLKISQGGASQAGNIISVTDGRLAMGELAPTKCVELWAARHLPKHKVSVMVFGMLNGVLFCWGPEGWGPEGWGPEGPKISRCFSFSRHSFCSFFPFLLVLLVEFWWCLKRRGAQNVHVWALGLSCETPAPPWSPLIWRSHKMHRVVGSTSPAETQSLLNGFWHVEWIAVLLKHVSQILMQFSGQFLASISDPMYCGCQIIV